MLGTVQFDHKAGVVAVKVGDILIDDLLPQKTNRITSQEVVP